MELIITSQIRGENYYVSGANRKTNRKCFQTKQWQTYLIDNNDNNIYSRIQTYLSAASEQKSKIVRCVWNIEWRRTLTKLFVVHSTKSLSWRNNWTMDCLLLLYCMQVKCEYSFCVFSMKCIHFRAQYITIALQIPAPMLLDDGNE